ncbi:MAG: hypothetical protein NTX33_10830 [Propionibacteriales bacterium]|nr:hypothetical protein [Propionibacteriales bacterium]
MAIDEWDAGIVAKLKRALQLRDELKKEQLRLRGEGLDPRKYESRSNPSDATNPEVHMEWRLTAAPDRVPLEFSALLGDVIQNLRASLDYATWAAASPGARKHNAPQVSFPLHKKKQEYLDWLRRKSAWFNADTLRVIEAAQLYHAPADQLHPLRILQVLSNTDKHRLLNVVDHAHIDLGIFMDPMPPDYDWWAAEGPVNVGETLAKLSFPRPLKGGWIDVSPSFGWYECVAFEEPGEDVRWLRIDEMMNAVCSFTVDIVSYLSGARLGLTSQDSENLEEALEMQAGVAIATEETPVEYPG